MSSATARPVPAAAVLAQGLAAVEAVVRGWPAPSSTPNIVADSPAGLDIVFGAAGNAAWATHTGWSAPEPGFLWSVGQRSELRLPASIGRLLLIELAPFVDAGRLGTQRITILANDTPVAAFQLTDLAVLSVPLPVGVAKPGEPLTLVFITPDAARPAEVSGFPDDRMLAFSFRRLLVEPPRLGVARFEPPAMPGDAPPLPRDELMRRFESLGENCEFGLVQRLCGSEPLGLLRFASAPLPKLRAALRADFAGMGQPDNVEVQISANRQEYMVHDRVFGFNYHAWIKVGEQSQYEVHAREVKRVPLLIRKLLEDLQAGEKIFVFHGMQALTLENACDLKADIARHGPGKLLWVEPADAGHQPGEIEWAAPGLLKGYIDRLAPGEDAHDISLECWLQLCDRAVAAIEAAQPG